MLVQFTIKNYKIFKEEAKLSLIASNYDNTRAEENIFSVPQFNLKLLKSAVIYGANASGKSKLIEAMYDMKRFILKSSKENQVNEPINVEPFRLSTETEKEPSFFEIIFIYQNEMYRYGFEATKKKIVSEWLYHRPKTKEVELFFREGQKFNPHPTKFKIGANLVKDKMIRSNALLLSVAAQFNDKISTKIFEWFNKFKVISGLKEEGYASFTVSRIEEPHIKNNTIELLKSADINIEDIHPQVLDINDLPERMPKALKDFLQEKAKEENTRFFSDVMMTHKKFNEKLQVIGNEHFSLDEEESSGTKKFFNLSGPIMDTLNEGNILVVDELDSKLHPNLVCKIVEIFNSKDKNPHNAQLIFNTHDTNLLDSGLFRRDQIWFTEKNRYGAASLYSLADFKTDTVRKDENFEKNYIKGKYGAVPYLGEFEKLFTF